MRVQMLMVLLVALSAADLLAGARLRAHSRKASVREQEVESVSLESFIDSVEHHLVRAVALLANDTALHKHFRKELEKRNASKEVHEIVSQGVSKYQADIAKKGNDTANDTKLQYPGIPASFLKGQVAPSNLSLSDILLRPQIREAEAANRVRDVVSVSLGSSIDTAGEVYGVEALLANDTALHKHFRKELEQRNASKEVHEIVSQGVSKYQADLAKKVNDTANDTKLQYPGIPASFLKGQGAKSNSSSSKNLQQEQQVLKDLFVRLKSKISGFNKAERTDKKGSELRVAKVQERLDTDRKQLEEAKKSNPGSFDVERLTNRTRMEERELHYWNQVATNQHGMFHANLKMTHGLMSRVKDVLDAYSQKMTKGSVDSTTMKAIRAISLPRVFMSIKHSLRLEVQDEKEHRKLTEHLLK